MGPMTAVTVPMKAHCPLHNSLGHCRMSTLEPSRRTRATVILCNTLSRHLRPRCTFESVPGRFQYTSPVTFNYCCTRKALPTIKVTQNSVVWTSYGNIQLFFNLSSSGYPRLWNITITFFTRKDWFNFRHPFEVKLSIDAIVNSTDMFNLKNSTKYNFYITSCGVEALFLFSYDVYNYAKACLLFRLKNVYLTSLGEQKQNLLTDPSETTTSCLDSHTIESLTLKPMQGDISASCIKHIIFFSDD